MAKKKKVAGVHSHAGNIARADDDSFVSMEAYQVPIGSQLFNL